MPAAPGRSVNDLATQEAKILRPRRGTNSSWKPYPWGKIREGVAENNEPAWHSLDRNGRGHWFGTRTPIGRLVRKERVTILASVKFSANFGHGKKIGTIPSQYFTDTQQRAATSNPYCSSLWSLTLTGIVELRSTQRENSRWWCLKLRKRICLKYKTNTYFYVQLFCIMFKDGVY